MDLPALSVRGYLVAEKLIALNSAHAQLLGENLRTRAPNTPLIRTILKLYEELESANLNSLQG
jgi:hypothetical protein